MAVFSPREPPTSLHVVVRHAATGEQLQLELVPRSTAYTVKCAVAKEWQVPPLCQLLELGGDGGEVVDDARALLHDFQQLPDGSALLFAMREHYDDLETALSKESPFVARILAVQVLAQMARRDRQKALTLNEEALEDADPQVRRAAIGVVAGTAPQGDEQAVQTLAACLQDVEEDVRWVAADSLAQVVGTVQSSDEQELFDARQLALETVGELLTHWRGGVRRAAVVALAQLAKRGDEFPVKVLCGCLASEDSEVAESALRALLLVCCPGGEPQPHREAAESLGQVLREAREAESQSSPHMVRTRCLAVQALAHVVAPMDRLATAQLLTSALDPSASVRLAALEGLRRVAQRGQEKTVGVLLQLLGQSPANAPKEKKKEQAQGHVPGSSSKPPSRGSGTGSFAADGGQDEEAQASRPGTREEAGVGGEEGADKDEQGDEQEEAEDEEEEEEEESERTPSLTSSAADRELVSALAEASEPEGPADEDPQVRRAALAALGALGEEGDMPIIRAVGARLTDTAPEVRAEAAATLALMVPPRNHRAVGFCVTLSSRLCEHRRGGVRLTGVEVLVQAAPVGNQDAVKALAARAAAPAESAEVRKAAAAALARVAAKGDPTASAALLSCLDDRLAEVRLAGLQALSHTASRKGDAAIEQAFAERLKDRDAGVRAAAAAALRSAGREPAGETRALQGWPGWAP